jgi:hypothetical protein
MNRSHLIHILFALACQLAIGLLTGNWWAGAAFGAAFFVGREHAQRQYKIAGWTKGLSINELNAWEGFDFFLWKRDALLDLFAPVLVVIGVALILA